jgi:peptidoglycan-associated lipoprotein
MTDLSSRKSISFLLLVLVFGSAACHKTLPAAPVVAAPPPPPPPAAPTISLGADRSTITAGQSVTLSWQSTNATAVMIDGGVGNVPITGARLVSPQASTSYAARATGPGGTAVSAVVRIAVNPVATPPVAVRPAAPPAAVPPNRTPTVAEQFRDTMQNVLFDYDNASIRDSEVSKLQSSANWLKRNPTVRFTIEGNADERGSQEYNVALGDERAAAVKKYLNGQGVEESRITTISYGEERPACREQSEDCWQRNRRAQYALHP